MDALDQRLAQSTVSACEARFGAQITLEHIQIQQTRIEFEGDRTVVVFPLTQHSKKSPEETGKALGKWLVANDELIESYQVVKGFLNLTIVPAYWTEKLLQVNTLETFGINEKGSKSSVMVEYSSPNTNKPLHMGHLRNNFLGYSVSRILEAAGHEVIKVQIINDRGIHICKSMVAWQMFGNGETPESSGLKGDKLVGKYYVAFDRAFKGEVAELLTQGINENDAKKQAPILLEAQSLLHRWEQGDKEVVKLWKTMNGWVYDGFKETYSEMGVNFDKLYYESETYLHGKNHVAAGLKSDIFYQKEDGSVWIDLRDEGLDEKLLLRKDGTAVYITQDIGTAILRHCDFPGLERQIYTVGNEQEYHFKVLFTILKKLGIEGADKNHHLSYGMVELPEGKMKSREGTVVDADDLLEEMVNTAREMATELGKIDSLSEEKQVILFKQVGYGALKYFLLKVSPKKSMMFDPKASIDFIGNTAPFIQFNYVRASSMLAKCAEAGINTQIKTIDASVWDVDELRLIQHTLMWPGTIELAAQQFDPSLIANYTYDLTKAFSRWYQDHQVLGEEIITIREARIALTQCVARTIKVAMGLLGIEMPQRM